MQNAVGLQVMEGDDDHAKVSRPLCPERAKECIFVHEEENVRGLRGIDKMLCFFDVDVRRWYSIQASELPRVCARGNVTQLIAVRDRLVCELTSVPDTDEDNLVLTLSDPDAKTRRMLPTPPIFFRRTCGLPKILTVADMPPGATRSSS